MEPVGCKRSDSFCRASLPCAHRRLAAPRDDETCDLAPPDRHINCAHVGEAGNRKTSATTASQGAGSAARGTEASYAAAEGSRSENGSPGGEAHACAGST